MCPPRARARLPRRRRSRSRIRIRRRHSTGRSLRRHHRRPMFPRRRRRRHHHHHLPRARFRHLRRRLLRAPSSRRDTECTALAPKSEIPEKASQPRTGAQSRSDQRLSATGHGSPRRGPQRWRLGRRKTSCTFRPACSSFSREGSCSCSSRPPLRSFLHGRSRRGLPPRLTDGVNSSCSSPCARSGCVSPWPS